MLFSKRSREGYLQIDHRGAEGGLSHLDTQASPGAIPVRQGMNFESATITCHHCQRVVILNPDRSRPRGYCPKCDHYVCDQCETVRVASGGTCRPYKQVIDEYLNTIAKQGVS